MVLMVCHISCPIFGSYKLEYMQYIKNKDDSSTGYKTCCKSPTYDLQCVRRYSAASTGSAPTTAEIACSSGYEMVGCSGYGIYGDLNSFWINENDNHCYARGATSNKVYAIAIWYVLKLI